MHLHLGCDALPHGLDADPPEQVVDDRGEDGDADERREQPSLHELEERQPEDVERRVLVLASVLKPATIGADAQVALVVQLI